MSLNLTAFSVRKILIISVYDFFQNLRLYEAETMKKNVTITLTTDNNDIRWHPLWVTL